MDWMEKKLQNTFRLNNVLCRAKKREDRIRSKMVVTGSLDGILASLCRALYAIVITKVRLNRYWTYCRYKCVMIKCQRQLYQCDGFLSRARCVRCCKNPTLLRKSLNIHSHIPNSICKVLPATWYIQFVC